MALMNKGELAPCEKGTECKYMHETECYYNAPFCCESCQRKFKILGCEYGDRSNFCKTSDCDYSREVCCKTCKFRSPNETEPDPGTGCIDFTNSSQIQTTKLSNNLKGKRCDEMIIVEGPGICYDFEVVCCATCLAYWDASNQQCAYGDKNSSCNALIPSDCYQLERDCCKTCQKFATGLTNCKYGDKRQQCSRIERRSCYYKKVEITCCKSCLKFRSNVRDCRYGDRIPNFCSRLSKRDCYSVTNRRHCCETCRRMASNDVNCLFGDRSFPSVCKFYRDVMSCETDFMMKNCCQTCSV